MSKSKCPWFLAVICRFLACICRFLAVICGSLSVWVGSWRLYVGSWWSSAVPGGYLVLGVLLSCSGQLKIGKGHLKRRMMKKSQDPSIKRCKKTVLSFSVVGPEQSSASMQNVERAKKWWHAGKYLLIALRASFTRKEWRQQCYCQGQN